MSEKYTLDIITEAWMLGARLANFPSEQNPNLALANGALIDDPKMYRRLVGHLITCPLLGPTWLVHFTLWHSLCKTPTRNIGTRPFAQCAI